MKRLCAAFLALTLLLCGCQSATADPTASAETTAATEAPAASGTRILLSDSGITVDGQVISGDSTSAVYSANDIVYYQSGQDFTYGEGTEADAHTSDEAGIHTVIHITQPGEYHISGTLSAGQIAVDLGEDAETDPEAVVTLVLEGADITCTVAPAVIFYRVYECGDEENPSATVDTSAAGANVILAAGTVNNITGSYVARIYEPGTVVLNEDGDEVEEAAKLHKYDGAFYSRMSMNVGGEGTLNIQAENEGLDSELHLTINGGDIHIRSGNDGINTNADGVSVTTINGGNVTITVDGSTGEGDGIDSNGWLVINGGSVTAWACGASEDSGIDSDMGIYINGGTVAASGNMLDQIAGAEQNYAVFTFASTASGGQTIALKNADGEAIMECTPENDYRILILSGQALAAGEYTLWQGQTQLAGAAGQSFGGMMSGFDQLPGTESGDGTISQLVPGGQDAGMEPPEGMEIPENGQMPGGELPEGMEQPEGVDPGAGMQPGQQPQGGGMTDGEVPEMPEGAELPEGMQPGEGMELPEGMQPGEGMELPEGMEIPEGMDPGEGGMGFGGFGQAGMAAGELSTVFPIASGANYFSAVSPAQS